MSDRENDRGAALEQELEEMRSGAEGQANEKTTKQTQAERGFAAMDPSVQKEIARKGGAAVSRDRDHMANIGRKGGEAVSKNREHMSEIGRKGGKAGGDRTSS